jgi:hypothetical protein
MFTTNDPKLPKLSQPATFELPDLQQSKIIDFFSARRTLYEEAKARHLSADLACISHRLAAPKSSLALGPCEKCRLWQQNGPATLDHSAAFFCSESSNSPSIEFFDQKSLLIRPEGLIKSHLARNHEYPSSRCEICGLEEAGRLIAHRNRQRINLPDPFTDALLVLLLAAVVLLGLLVVPSFR